MMIEWNKVTWYSKLLTIILLFGVLPTLAFIMGMQYEQVVMQYDALDRLYQTPVAVASESEHTPSAYAQYDSSGNPIGWITYSNARFGFRYYYPQVWPIGRESENGDGIELYFDGTNSVKVYASYVPDTAPQDMVSYPVGQTGEIALKNGDSSRVFEGNKNGKSYYIAALLKDGVEYSFFAEGSSDFIISHKDALRKAAASLELFTPPYQ